MKRAFQFFLILILLFCFSSLTFAAGQIPIKPSFLYILQNININQIANSNFSYLIIDLFTYEDGKQRSFSKSEINKLIEHDKIPICYLSIGEAEIYRYYWKKSWAPYSPVWLLPENPNWKGNYKVKYWHPEWQKTVLNYVDKIIDAGFVGIYLDLVDSYQYFPKNREAKQKMIDFVIKIAKYAREKSNNQILLLIPQNAEELITDKEYLKAIDGIGRESTYYGYSKAGEKTDPKITKQIEHYLDLAVKANKLVFCTDYVTNKTTIKELQKKSNARHYLEYCTTPALDRIVEQ